MAEKLEVIFGYKLPKKQLFQDCRRSQSVFEIISAP
jgi:hypothetical protein